MSKSLQNGKKHNIIIIVNGACDMEYSKIFPCLKKLISFESVKGEAKEGAPFGDQNRLALDYFLSLAKDFGFKTINYDGYGGEIVVGEGEEIGIMGHLDVVPVGSGWNTPPFELTEKDGKLIARGVEDDKGPTLLCLFALKELVDDGVKFNRKIRFFVGCNEEDGWKDVEYMQSKTQFPKYGFSPDGNFPATYAEKGVYLLKLKLPKLTGFANLLGGKALNAVCDLAKVEVEESQIDKTLIEKLGLNLVNGNTLESVGITAHGSHPEEGKNAFRAIFSYMQERGVNLNGIVEKLFDDGIGLSNYKNEQGWTSVSPNLAVKTKDGYELWCDLRVPAPLKAEELVACLDKLGIEYTIVEKHPPFMTDKNCFMIKALSDAYSSVTKKDGTPKAMCGSTYARVFEQGASFGIGDDIWPGSCHQANEFVDKKHFLESYEIYKQAIYNIVK